MITLLKIALYVLRSMLTSICIKVAFYRKILFNAEIHFIAISSNLKTMDYNNLDYLKVIGPDGTIYNSISMCAKSTGHDRHTIAEWIKNHPEKGYKFID